MSKKALVLLNMGGASNLDEVEVFLDNMFADPLILRIPRPFRRLVALMIIKSRIKESKENYKLIGSKSPLLDHTVELAQNIEKISGYKAVIAMRYTPPFAKEAVKQLADQGITEAVLIPLYPQYSTTTTLSSLRDFEDELKRQKVTIDTKKIERFFDYKPYNDLLLELISEATKDIKTEDFVFVFSAHGLPQSVIKSGDPYQKECEEHSAILSTMLGGSFKEYHLAYQSRLGPVKWTEPSLDEKLRELAESGHKKVVVLPLAFTIDNLETDFELSIEYREIASELGFEEYIVVPAANGSEAFARVLIRLADQL